MLFRSGPVLIHIDSDLYQAAPDSEAWWDVPVAQVSDLDTTRTAYAAYADQKTRQRPLLGPGTTAGGTDAID